MTIAKSFRYVSAAESAKPGYLARKFAAERKRLAEEAEKLKATEAEAQVKVRKIKQGSA